jgi:hypothetical protein
MRINSLDKARGRLRSARRSLIAMKNASDADSLYDHWVDFLAAWKAVWTHIEQAAKSTQQELMWFSAVKKERRADALLTYLFEARNDETHGLDPSVDRYSAYAKFDSPSGKFAINAIRFNANDGTVSLLSPDGDEVGEPISIPPNPLLILRSIKARGNRLIEPPQSHMGSRIEAIPEVVAEHGLRYIETLVQTAEALHQP